MIKRKISKETFYNVRPEYWISGLLVVATIGVYWQVKDFGFVNLDDYAYVVENLNIKSGLTAENIVWAFSAFRTSNWHPLTWLSHIMDVQMFGMNPGAHHCTNLILHIANSLLIFHLLRKMTMCPYRSGFVAALFALHPLHVESVAWISERKDVLSTLFWLLTTWSYVRYVEHPSIKRNITTLALFSLGLMAKPMLVTLPFIFLLMDFWPLGRFQSFRVFPLKLVVEKMPFLVLSGISCTVAFIAQQHGGSVAPLDILPLSERIANALVSYQNYLWKMIWPFHLGVFYPYHRKLPWGQVLGAALFLLICFWAALRFKERYSWLTVGWFWYVGTLVPVIGLVQVGMQAMADRYTYIPLIGIFIIVSWGVPEVTKILSLGTRLTGVLGAVMIFLLMPISWMQVGHWKNTITLYEHTVKVTTDNSITHQRLGSALLKEGEVDRAIEHISVALGSYPDDVDLMGTMGIALLRKGKLVEAIQLFQHVVQNKPDAEEIRHNLDKASDILEKIEKAVMDMKFALQLCYEGTIYQDNLENLDQKKAVLETVIEEYQKALSMFPGYQRKTVDINNLPGVREVMNKYGLAQTRKNFGV